MLTFQPCTLCFWTWPLANKPVLDFGFALSASASAWTWWVVCFRSSGENTLLCPCWFSLCLWPFGYLSWMSYSPWLFGSCSEPLLLCLSSLLWLWIFGLCLDKDCGVTVCTWRGLCVLNCVSHLIMISRFDPVPRSSVCVLLPPALTQSPSALVCVSECFQLHRIGPHGSCCRLMPRTHCSPHLEPSDLLRSLPSPPEAPSSHIAPVRLICHSVFCTCLNRLSVSLASLLFPRAFFPIWRSFSPTAPPLLLLTFITYYLLPNKSFNDTGVWSFNWVPAILVYCNTVTEEWLTDNYQFQFRL